MGECPKHGRPMPCGYCGRLRRDKNYRELEVWAKKAAELISHCICNGAPDYKAQALAKQARSLGLIEKEDK